MSKKVWSVSHSRDGFAVELEREQWWVSPYITVLDAIDVATRHMICGSGLPGWTFRVRVGRGGDVETLDDGSIWIEKSLGGKMWDFGQKLFNFSERGITRVKSIPVDKDTGIFLWPNNEDSWLWDDDSSEVETTE